MSGIFPHCLFHGIFSFFWSICYWPPLEMRYQIRWSLTGVRKEYNTNPLMIQEFSQWMNIERGFLEGKKEKLFWSEMRRWQKRKADRQTHCRRKWKRSVGTFKTVLYNIWFQTVALNLMKGFWVAGDIGRHDWGDEEQMAGDADVVNLALKPAKIYTQAYIFTLE